MEPAQRVLLNQLLSTLLLPGVVTLALALAPLKLRPAAGPRTGATAAAIGAGLLTGFLAILGWPEGYPPADSIDWLIPLPAVAAAALGALGHKPQGPRRWIAGGLAVLLMALFGYLVMMPLFAQQGTWWPQLLVAVLVGAVAFMGLGRAAAEAPASASFASLSLTALGASAAVGLCGSALVAQLLGMVAAVNGLMALLGLWRPALRPGQGALAASLLTTEALLLYGFSYLDMSTPAVLLVGLLPLVALASTRAQGRLKPALVSLGVGGLLLLPAAWLSYQVGFSTEQGYDNPASDQEQGGYGYGDAHTEAGYGYEQEGSGDSAGAYGYGGAHTGGGQ